MPNLTGLATSVTPDGRQRHMRFYLWNGRNRMRKYDWENWRNAGIAAFESNIKTTALTTNVVTITTVSAHNLVVNNKVRIYTTSNNQVYGGDYTVTTTPSSTTFTYARTNANISSADNAGKVWLRPTTADAGSGSGLTGEYYYYLVPGNSLHLIGDGSIVCANPSLRSDAVIVNNSSVSITLIPATHPDGQVDRWYIYRNKDGYLDVNGDDDFQDFFLVGSVAIGTTTFTDNVPDDSLPPIYMSQFNEIPPTSSWGEVFGNRLFQGGFDPITTGTATVNANTCLVDFASVTLPDGVVGCKFQKQGDEKIYEIVERPSTTQVALAEPFSGTLSAASYAIFRDPSMLYFSEWDNFDAYGQAGEGFRNRIPVGGPGSADPLIVGKALGGSLWVFTQTKIYRVYGQGPDQTAVRITPDPFYDGIGCVGKLAICSTDNELYFLSLRGPMRFTGEGPPEPIGDDLGTTWLDSLNASQLGIALAYTDGRKVKFCVPQTGETENSLVFVFDRFTRTWWREEFVHPTCALYDLDSNGKPTVFYGQGKFIVQDELGTSDGVPSGTITGSPTSATTTTLTDTGATFYTTGSGLTDRYVHIYTTAGVLRGRRRITSNTATALTWATALSGILTTDVYYVGPVLWWWKTKNYAIPAVKTRQLELHVDFDDQSESTDSSLFINHSPDDGELSATQSQVVNSNHKKFFVNSRGFEYAAKLECRATDNQVAIRSITLEGLPEEEDK